jgi:hypothetical protein
MAVQQIGQLLDDEAEEDLRSRSMLRVRPLLPEECQPLGAVAVEQRGCAAVE